MQILHFKSKGKWLRILGRKVAHFKPVFLAYFVEKGRGTLGSTESYDEFMDFYLLFCKRLWPMGIVILFVSIFPNLS